MLHLVLTGEAALSFVLRGCSLAVLKGPCGTRIEPEYPTSKPALSSESPVFSDVLGATFARGYTL